MAGIRALQRRLKRVEDAGKPRPSQIALWYGSFDAWVEHEIIPGIESGALDAVDMIDVVAALRAWEADDMWSHAM